MPPASPPPPRYCATTLPLDPSGRLLPVRRRASPGLVALAPGALLDVQLDTRLATGRTNPSAAVRLSVECLTSYVGHGVVAARCARGCRCDERIVDANVPEPSGAATPNASMHYQKACHDSWHESIDMHDSQIMA